MDKKNKVCGYIRWSSKLQNDNSSKHKQVKSITEGATSNLENENRAENMRGAWSECREEIKNNIITPINSLPGWLRNVWILDQYGLRTKEISGYVADEGHSKTIKRIYKMFLDGMSAKRIAKTLNNEKVPTISHKKINTSCWWNVTVVDLLKDKSVCGYYTQVEPHVKILPEIIDLETFNKVQSIVESRKVHRPYRCGHTPLLTRLMRCSVCGDRFKIIKSVKFGNLKTRKDYSSCRNGYEQNNKCASKNRYIRGDLTEKVVLDIFQNSEIIHRSLKEEEEPSKLPELNKRLEEYKILTKKYTSVIIEDTEPSETIIKLLKESEKNTKNIQKEIDKEIKREEHKIDSNELIMNIKEELKNRINDMEYREKLRNLLSAVIDKIVVNLETNSFILYIKDCEPIEVFLPKRYQHNNEYYTIEGMRFSYDKTI